MQVGVVTFKRALESKPTSALSPGLADPSPDF
jgi:hypothetical protein